MDGIAEPDKGSPVVPTCRGDQRARAEEVRVSHICSGANVHHVDTTQQSASPISRRRDTRIVTPFLNRAQPNIQPEPRLFYIRSINSISIIVPLSRIYLTRPLFNPPLRPPLAIRLRPPLPQPHAVSDEGPGPTEDDRAERARNPGSHARARTGSGEFPARCSFGLQTPVLVLVQPAVSRVREGRSRLDLEQRGRRG